MQTMIYMPYPISPHPLCPITPSLGPCKQMEPPEKEFMVCALDLLSGMSEGLGGGFGALLANSNLLQMLLQVWSLCLLSSVVCRVSRVMRRASRVLFVVQARHVRVVQDRARSAERCSTPPCCTAVGIGFQRGMCPKRPSSGVRSGLLARIGTGQDFSALH